MRAHARILAASEARGTREGGAREPDNAIVTFSRDYVTLTVQLFIYSLALAFLTAAS